MTAGFVMLAVVSVVGAVASMTLRNVVHCVLSLVVTFAGLALIYLQLGAQFVGFAQILVYIGAVTILVVFAILLTRSLEAPETANFSSGWVAGVGVAAAVFGVLAFAVLSSRALGSAPPAREPVGAVEIGKELMTNYVLPLEVVGLLLTAALIGAVILALRPEGKP